MHIYRKGHDEMDFFDQFFTLDLIMGVQYSIIALVMLIVGWLVAKVVGNLVESGLTKTNVDERFFNKFRTSDKPINTNKIVGKAVYYILLVIAFMLFFDRLQLSMIANPLSELISTFFAF